MGGGEEFSSLRGSLSTIGDGFILKSMFRGRKCLNTLTDILSDLNGELFVLERGQTKFVLLVVLKCCSSRRGVIVSFLQGGGCNIII